MPGGAGIGCCSRMLLFCCLALLRLCCQLLGLPGSAASMLRPCPARQCRLELGSFCHEQQPGARAPHKGKQSLRCWQATSARAGAAGAASQAPAAGPSKALLQACSWLPMGSRPLQPRRIAWGGREEGRAQAACLRLRCSARPSLPSAAAQGPRPGWKAQEPRLGHGHGCPALAHELAKCLSSA